MMSSMVLESAVDAAGGVTMETGSGGLDQLWGARFGARGGAAPPSTNCVATSFDSCEHQVYAVFP